MQDYTDQNNDKKPRLNVERLIDLPIPSLIEEQLAKFSIDSIHSQEIMNFDATTSLHLLNQHEGKKVLVADFGGDKGKINLFKIVGSQFVVIDGFEDYIQGDDGKGYLDLIEKASSYADKNAVPFGLVWGGPMDRTKMLFHPKAKILFEELKTRYDGDFSNISSSVKAIINDGPAGVIGGALHAYKKFSANNVIFLINGGGLGVGVLKNGTVYATESGHVEAVKTIKKYGLEIPCGVFGQEFTCLENLGSNKKGIEPTYEVLRNEKIPAIEIESRYLQGDERAKDVYDYSAYIVAHIIKGVAKTFNLDLNDSSTAVVCDGSAFKFPYYGERIEQILSADLENKPQLLMTKDYINPNTNVFMHGVALATLNQ